MYQCGIEKNMEYIENNIFEIGKEIYLIENLISPNSPKRPVYSPEVAGWAGPTDPLINKELDGMRGSRERI